ncbi:sensor histidine kinase [Nocardiopsis baichengensis]|uniref:sensor histidine kinase n=1 Tax=Nocardiopsis baichengensis TaxID=280240 RepID=UPI000A312E50|nr:ATP-binding protein [Nocardiopsis baichengensis]
MMTNENARHRQPGRFRRLMSRMGLARRDPDPVTDPAAEQYEQQAPAARDQPAPGAQQTQQTQTQRLPDAWPPQSAPAEAAEWAAAFTPEPSVPGAPGAADPAQYPTGAQSPYAVPDPAQQPYPGAAPGHVPGPYSGAGPAPGAAGTGGYARPQAPPNGGPGGAQGGGLRPSQGPSQGRQVPVAQGPMPVNGGGTATAVRQDAVRMTDFVAGMAMRDLNLVDALLATVEELEDTADDPSLMDRLFEIDNLATRMRRHSENLLLLTDQPVVEPDEEPVSVLDVARAAISEIKDYPRVQVGRLPNGFVLGTAADDISHLLAELLDNATQHSPEHAQVVISAQPMADGGLLYIVEDEGVGLPREEVSDLNSRLSGPPRLDQRALRHMGLYVASRIAYRHGLTVQLEARAFRGVSAYAVVPANLLTDKGPRPERGKGMTASRNTPSLPPRPPQHTARPAAPPPGTPPQSAVTEAGLPRRSAHRDPAKAAMLQQIAQDLAAEDGANAAGGANASGAAAQGRHGRRDEGPVEDRAAQIRDELDGFLEGERRATGREQE